MLFADVILPRPLPLATLTYIVPDEMQSLVSKGFRVIVPLGERKLCTGIVARLHSDKPTGFKLKEIHSLVDSKPIVTQNQLSLWEWISFYYICPLGEVCYVALPSKFKLDSETTISLGETFSAWENLSPTEMKIVGFLQHDPSKKIKALEKAVGIKNVLPHIHSMVFKGAISTDEAIRKKIAAKTEKFDLPLGTAEAQRKPYALNAYQQEAFLSIKQSFQQKQVCLLHGVTSSGKTEIYIHLIEEMLQDGKQVLYLVPEIALSTQLTQRLRGVFGTKLGVYHSKINDSERAEIWQKMLSPRPYGIIVGVRSSLFIPFSKLGLIIVDEEHETSYKQQDPSPRYHARDTAIVMAQQSGAKTLLGSATPSFESYYNAQTGKYGLVTLSKRFEEIELPEIRLENTAELRRKRKMKSILSPSLIELIQRALADGEQVILFRNRRGFAPLLECNSCAWTPKCKRCDVALTYHKFLNELKCHYCNATYKIPKECPVCHETQIDVLGQGTEQVEEEALNLFPDAVSARMDTDTTRTKNSAGKIIADFEDKKIQILIGTQMLAKGLDFENVSVVGIISADSLLNHPDFRSYERGFQMMLQTSGRAGRKNKRGTVVIQTSDPAQAIYRFVENNDYRGFFLAQMAERKNFRYPPFFRLISIVLKHKKEDVAEAASQRMAEALRQTLSDRVLGPAKPLVSRIQSYYIREILLKLEAGLPPSQLRENIIHAEQKMRKNADYKYIILSYNVDPL
ncbi:MAG: primosomal protein N' [Dysgonamonadaceae bacterium]|jgi:primosomal protein N' (replication factor Y)|nr:primosomal protein N' [Dysgonamonadaceae bacterium]